MDMPQARLQPAPQLTADTRSRARRGLGIYFAVLVPISVVLYALAIQNPSTLWFFLLMVTPTVASLVARLALREGIADVSFRLGGWRGVRALGVALVFPVIVGGLAYGLAWTTDLATFAAPPEHPLVAILVGDNASPALQFGALLLLTLTLGTLGTGIAAAGEEIGWRGYMLTRLIDAGVPAPALASGLIWGLWHSPLIIAGQYAAGPSPLLSVLIFLVGVTAVGVIFARLRLDTGSVWPAVLLHASWNAVIQSAFNQATTGANAALWIGESGLLVALVLVTAALIAARRPLQASR